MAAEAHQPRCCKDANECAKIANMDKNTFETLARLLRIMTYMFEDGDQPEDKEVLDDIGHVRAWMAEIEKDVD